MNKVLCSTGALLGRPNGRNYHLLGGFAKELECDGFELMIYDTWYHELDRAVSEIGALNLDIPVIHCEKGIGELLAERRYKEAAEYFSLNCGAAAKLGAEKLVLHLWNGIISDSRIENNFAAVPELLSIAGEYKLKLTVENVVCNSGDPLEHLMYLLENTGVGFTFDTKMAAFHGETERIFAPEMSGFWGGRINHLHINDYGGSIMDWKNLRVLHIGDGNINFTDFFGKLSGKNYTGDYTVEATSFGADGKVDTASLNRDFAYIRSHI